jgi:SHS family lactate transporter-like MFS transporter
MASSTNRFKRWEGLRLARPADPGRASGTGRCLDPRLRVYVKEPEIWAENQRIQTETKQEVKLPLLAIFKLAYLWNTITGCVWMAANFCVYYSFRALFSTYLQKELGWTPLMVATPLFWANIVVFFSLSF